MGFNWTLVGFTLRLLLGLLWDSCWVYFGTLVGFTLGPSLGFYFWTSVESFFEAYFGTSVENYFRGTPVNFFTEGLPDFLLLCKNKIIWPLFFFCIKNLS